MQKLNPALHEKLPANIIKSKVLIVANDGTVPPYIIHEDNSIKGANIDFLTALSEILGVTIKHEQVSGIPALLLGVKSDRFDLAIGPISDRVERQKEVDFVDFIRDYAALAVLKGNPAGIELFVDFCDKRIAVQAGSIAEKLLNTQSEACIKQGKQPITLLTFKDQATAFLAVKSERADAFMTGVSMIGYYLAQDKNQLDLVPIGLKADYPTPMVYQGAIVAKNSPLGPVLLAAFQELVDNGTYLAIMQKWGLNANAIDKPGMNLAK